MRTQSPDTSPEAERVQIELLRQVDHARRLGIMASLNETVWRLSWRGIQQANPEADDAEVGLISLALNYGQDVADQVRLCMKRSVMVSIPPDVFSAMIPVIDAFEQLGVTYYIGGSVASSRYGIPRSTLDLDLVADLRLDHVQPFVQQLQETFYVDESAVREAIQWTSSFNLISLSTFVKIDVFIRKTRPYDQEAFQRVRVSPVSEAEESRPVHWVSPEDLILAKLEWYRMGGEVSDRQWNDILGVMKLQGARLDLTYLRQWGQSIAVADLLERALVDAGLADE
ncbi:MAG: hypothetical protein ACRDHP_20785 [Ktedonobacterales bacterium]